MRALFFALALAACSPAAENADTTAETPAPAAEAPAETASAGTQAENLAQMPPWEGARAAGVDFRGVGQEPGWIMDIYTRGIIKLAWAYGENFAQFAVTQPANGPEGTTLWQGSADGRDIAVTILRAPCQDAMSGEAYPSTVEVVIDGQTLRGCGRSV